MAQKVSVTLEDDIDGSEAVETVTFALSGQDYEIDLNEKNAAKLRKALAPYVEHGRRHTAKRGPVAAKRAVVSRGEPEPGQVRAWARREGVEINARGRIPSAIIAKFRAAH